MQIVVAGIPIDVQKKKIKNMHLQVKPPDGHVVISAPASVDDKAIEAYARVNLSWIREARTKFSKQARNSKRQYISGETIYFWGKQYYIRFIDSNKNSLSFDGEYVVLRMKNKSTVKRRESFIREQYREMLKQEINKRLPQWEKITGINCDSWQTKYMITKWGSCNTEKRKLWFNIQLAQKPIQCLDYIIVHELVHLEERKHNAAFIYKMDSYYPNWRDVRRELNEQILDYYHC